MHVAGHEPDPGVLEGVARTVFDRGPSAKLEEALLFADACDVLGLPLDALREVADLHIVLHRLRGFEEPDQGGLRDQPLGQGGKLEGRDAVPLDHLDRAVLELEDRVAGVCVEQGSAEGPSLLDGDDHGLAEVSLEETVRAREIELEALFVEGDRIRRGQGLEAHRGRLYLAGHVGDPVLLRAPGEPQVSHLPDHRKVVAVDRQRYRGLVRRKRGGCRDKTGKKGKQSVATSIMYSPFAVLSV